MQAETDCELLYVVQQDMLRLLLIFSEDCTLITSTVMARNTQIMQRIRTETNKVRYVAARSCYKRLIQSASLRLECIISLDLVATTLQ